MSLREAYDGWASTYPPVPHNALMQAEQDAVTPWLFGRAALRVLDAGAGTGRYTPILRATGAALVVSLDWSWAMLQAQTVGAARVCGDALSLPFGAEVFDLVNVSLMAGDVKDLGPWVREMSRVLAAGGRIVYSDFHPTWHARGWRRTFRDESGSTVVLPCEPHGFDDHRRALAAAGLRLEQMREIAVTSPPRLVDRWLRRDGPTVPGLVVVSATKASEGPA